MLRCPTHRHLKRAHTSQASLPAELTTPIAGPSQSSLPIMRVAPELTVYVLPASAALLRSVFYFAIAHGCSPTVIGYGGFSSGEGSCWWQLGPCWLVALPGGLLIISKSWQQEGRLVNSLFPSCGPQQCRCRWLAPEQQQRCQIGLGQMRDSLLALYRMDVASQSHSPLCQ